MDLIKKISEIPENFSAFLDEMLPEYIALYGEEAGALYGEMIRPSLAKTLSDKNTVAFAMTVNQRVVGMVIGAVWLGAGHLHFVHVLSDSRGQGVESGLLDACVAEMKLQNPGYILAETIPLYAVNLDEPFESMGFNVVERLLMARTLTQSDAVLAEDFTRALVVEAEVAVARLLNETYADHEDRVLHHELQQREATLALIRRYRRGAYGRVDAEWVRVVSDSAGRCVGVIMGHALSGEVGYIYQVAVHPDHQGKGYGGQLLRSLLRVMADAGIKEVLLGVTVESSALALYRDMGFVVKREVNVYTRGKINR